MRCHIDLHTHALASDGALNDGEDVGWDCLLGDVNSAMDWPVPVYSERLTQSYPEARVMLSVREAAGQHERFKNTVLRVNSGKPGPSMEIVHQVISGSTDQLFDCGSQGKQRAIAGFRRLNTGVQER